MKTLMKQILILSLLVTTQSFAQGKGGNPNGDLAMAKLEEETPGKNDFERMAYAFHNGYKPDPSAVEGVWSIGLRFFTTSRYPEGYTYSELYENLVAKVVVIDSTGYLKPKLNAYISTRADKIPMADLHEFVSQLHPLLSPGNISGYVKVNHFAVTADSDRLNAPDRPITSYELRAYGSKDSYFLVAVEKPLAGLSKPECTNGSTPIEGVCAIYYFTQKTPWPTSQK